MLLTRIFIPSLILILQLVAGSSIAQSTIRSQSIFTSKEGVLSVTATYNGYSITAHSQKVEVWLDYETSIFSLRLAPMNLHTGIDSLDRQLSLLASPYTLKGNLSLGQIETDTHAPQVSQFTGTLESRKFEKIEVTGMVQLKHIDGGKEVACKLALYFDVDARSLGLHGAEVISGDQHLIKIQFYETVLGREY